MSSEIKVTNIKHSSSGSNNLVLASDGNVSLSGTLSAGTLGSSVVNNTSFIGFQGGTNGSNTFSTNDEIITFDQDVVNNGMTIMTGGDAGKIQVDKAGKYLVIAKAYGQHTNNSSRYFAITVNHNTSGIAGSGAVGFGLASDLRQSVTCQVIKQCAVNDNFSVVTVLNGDSIFGGNTTRLVIIYLGQ